MKNVLINFKSAAPQPTVDSVLYGTTFTVEGSRFTFMRGQDVVVGFEHMGRDFYPVFAIKRTDRNVNIGGALVYSGEQFFALQVKEVTGKTEVKE